MPRRKSSPVDRHRSSPVRRHVAISRSSNQQADPVDIRSQHHPIDSAPRFFGDSSGLPQPSYSETILQRPTIATTADSSTLAQTHVALSGPPSSQSRRQSSSSMRNASMTFENVAPTATPTGRISKAKKGKRVHACEFPGCNKVCLRQSACLRP